MDNIAERVIIAKHQLTVVSVRELTSDTYVLRLTRDGLEFQPGQYVVIGLPGKKEKREYSVYSGNSSPYLEVLIKVVDNGIVSHSLHECKVGDILEVEGPFGHFILDERKLSVQKNLFIATGTGIAPFHSMIMSYKEVKYTLIHGVRNLQEAYDYDHYELGTYIQCVSREFGGDFSGRVTAFLKNYAVDSSTNCYLCGNGAMVDDVYALLMEKGVPSGNIHAEIYF
jgi:ferredoxin/flavodoxin---NADP+ reductase